MVAEPPPVPRSHTHSDPGGVTASFGFGPSLIVVVPTRESRALRPLRGRNAFHDPLPRVALRDPGLIARTPPGSSIPEGCQPLAGGCGATTGTRPHTHSDPGGVTASFGFGPSLIVVVPTRESRGARTPPGSECISRSFTPGGARDPGLIAWTPPGSECISRSFTPGCAPRPGANRSDPSGVVHPGGMPAISRWLRSHHRYQGPHTHSDPGGVTASFGFGPSLIVVVPTRESRALGPLRGRNAFHDPLPRVALRDPGLIARTPPGSSIPEGCQPLAGGCGATTGTKVPTRIPTPEGLPGSAVGPSDRDVRRCVPRPGQGRAMKMGGKRYSFPPFSFQGFGISDFRLKRPAASPNAGRGYKADKKRRRGLALPCGFSRRWSPSTGEMMLLGWQNPTRSLRVRAKGLQVWEIGG